MADTTLELRKKEAEAPEGVERTRLVRVYTPDVDILETKETIVLTADMPGVDEKSVDISLEKNVLTIYGKVTDDMPENGRPAVVEYGIGDYQRAFTLSGEIDREKIKATVKNGVVRLALPKAETARMRKIEITAE